MLPEVNTTNPNFETFQSSVVGSMQESERIRKKKEPSRIKNVKQTKNKDQYSSTSKDTLEKDDTAIEPVTKKEKRQQQKQTRHANMHYAASAYNKQGNLNKRMKSKKSAPIAEI